MDGLARSVRSRLGGTVVGRGTRMEPSILSRLLRGRRDLERSVARARHDLPTGRSCNRRSGACLAHRPLWSRSRSHPHRTDVVEPGGGRGHAEGKRVVRRRPSRLRRRGIRSGRPRHRHRGPLVDRSSSSWSSTSTRRGHASRDAHRSTHRGQRSHRRRDSRVIGQRFVGRSTGRRSRLRCHSRDRRRDSFRRFSRGIGSDTALRATVATASRNGCAVTTRRSAPCSDTCNEPHGRDSGR